MLTFCFPITLILVYVETGLDDTAITKIELSLNGQIVGLRKWKVLCSK